MKVPLPAGLIVDLCRVLEKHGFPVQRVEGHKWLDGDQCLSSVGVEVRLSGEREA